MIRELDSRATSYGLSVALLWNSDTNETFIEMETETDWSRFSVHPEEARNAFDHPFVFQARAMERDADFQCLPRERV
jgi:hypothetical protein